MSAATTETVVLPYTGRTVPASLAAFKVTSLKQHNTHDGVAFAATLRHGKTIVGTIEDQGVGGGAWAYISDADVNTKWYAAMDDARQLPDIEYPEMVTELACSWLVDEYDNGRMIAKATKKGETIVERTSTTEFGCNVFVMYRTTDVDAVIEMETKNGKPFRIWVTPATMPILKDEQWLTIERLGG